MRKTTLLQRRYWSSWSRDSGAALRCNPRTFGPLVRDSQQTWRRRTFCIALGDLDGDLDLDAFVTYFLYACKVWINNGRCVCGRRQSIGARRRMVLHSGLGR